jgi:hypothetical protein
VPVRDITRDPVSNDNSLLWQHMRRRMVMRDAPFTVAPGHKHGEAGWQGYRLPIPHDRKLIKSGDYDGILTDYNCASLAERVPLSFEEVKYFTIASLPSDMIGLIVPRRSASGV